MVTTRSGATTHFAPHRTIQTRASASRAPAPFKPPGLAPREFVCGLPKKVRRTAQQPQPAAQMVQHEDAAQPQTAEAPPAAVAPAAAPSAIPATVSEACSSASGAPEASGAEDQDSEEMVEDSEAALAARRAAGQAHLQHAQELLDPGYSGWVSRTQHLVREAGPGLSRFGRQKPLPEVPVDQERPGLLASICGVFRGLIFRA